MSKTRRWVTILLTLAILLLININLTDRNGTRSDTIHSNAPSYKSDYSDMMIYNLDGSLNYRLIAQHIEYFPNEGVSWFTQPVMTIFDTNKMPLWLAKSARAKLTKNRILYLYGHVEVNALTVDAQLRKIMMNSAQINLITQDITSQDLVVLYGTTFNSSGLKMRGNLRNKNMELIEKARTLYEIQKKQTHL